MTGKSAVVLALIAFLVCFSEAKHDSCLAMMKEYSNNISVFFNHAGRHSEPFTFCSREFQYYRYVELSYEHFRTGIDIVTKKKCKDMYFDTNKFNMMEYLKNVADKLWKDAYCYDCFEPNDNITVDFKFTNFTTEFYEYHTRYNNCLAEYKNRTENNSKLPPEKRFNITRCDYCEGNYSLLNKLYDTYSKHRVGEVCFDLTDMMNKTRQEWSGEFKCCSQKKDSMTAFLAVGVSTVAILVTFYFSVYCYGIRSEDTHEMIYESEVTNSAQGSQQPPLPNQQVVPGPSSSTNNDLISFHEKQNKKAEEKRKALMSDDTSDDMIRPVLKNQASKSKE